MDNFNDTEDYSSSRFRYDDDNSQAHIFEYNNQTLNLLHTIFGTFGFVANFLWIFFLLLKKQRKRISIYFACYGLISSIISIAYIFEYSRKIHYKDDPRIVRPLDCMIYAFHPTLHSLMDISIVQAIFVMSVDFLLTILRSKFESYIGNKWVIYLLIFIYLSCATADLIFCWSSSSSKRNQSISIVCAGADILSKRYLIFHTVICSLLSYSAVAILFWSASVIKRQSSAIAEIQAIQHRRKTVVIKQLFYLILFTFIIQNMPFVAAFVILARKKNSLELDQVWLSQNMGLCFHGILRLIQQIPKNQNFSNQNCFCIIKRQNSVLSVSK
ncbi:hypothetical protein Tsp_09879 [Trichinella spiralis]|nr:hypothetical protein Tsp_09879 [Trichinella spiralis]KRY41695.1 hypothetical protein T01_1818 [Trichinella spiralis]